MAGWAAMSCRVEMERNVAGWYDLIGVSGSSLPARAVSVHLMTEGVDPCRILSGTLWLSQGGTYVLEVSAEHDGAPGVTYTQIIKDSGNWRFVAFRPRRDERRRPAHRVRRGGGQRCSERGVVGA